MVFQHLVWKILSGEYDAVVLGQEAKYASNVVLFVLAKLKGMTVVLWGFGYHVEMGFDPTKHWKGITRITVAVKNFWARQADAFLAYSRFGAKYLVENGMPPDRVTILNNTIDIDEHCRYHEEIRGIDPLQIRREFGLRPESVVLLVVGRLIPVKQVDAMLQALREIHQSNRCDRVVETLIIGDGQERAALEEQARGLPFVRFEGHVSDPRMMARYMKVAAGVVLPGAVGLAVNHALAHGRPVITRDYPVRIPEFEYIENDVNGLVSGESIGEFIDALILFIESPDLQARLQAGALKSREALRLSNMVSMFQTGVQGAVRRKRGLVPTQGV